MQPSNPTTPSSQNTTKIRTSLGWSPLPKPSRTGSISTRRGRDGRSSLCVACFFLCRSKSLAVHLTTTFPSNATSFVFRLLREHIHLRSTLPTSRGSSSQRSQTAISFKHSMLELSQMLSREALTRLSHSGLALLAILYVSLKVGIAV